MLRRRTADPAARLFKAREELAVVEEQLLHLADEADDTELRAIVSEDRLVGRDAREARRHAEAMARRRAELREQVARLERELGLG